MLPTHRVPTHPGEMLVEEFIKPLSEIARGRRGVTADTALRLAKPSARAPSPG